MRVAVTIDTEEYPNCFLLVARLCDSQITLVFEISTFRNESAELFSFLCWLRDNDAIAYGFNFVRWDGPIVHTFMLMGGRASAEILFQKAQAILATQDNEDRWAHTVRPSDRAFEWRCLFLQNHFDNKARSTSLKSLQFNMRMDSIQDLPFPVGTVLDESQIKVLRKYCIHDVEATERFRIECLPATRFREELTARYGRDFTNHNDTKIGKDYFIMELERAGVACYDVGHEGRTPRQTRRPSIALKDAILPWIRFEQPEFQRVVEWMRQQTITQTKGALDNLFATINGFAFVFGTGGIHGSVENEAIHSDADNVIVDLDVTSYYPTLAIANGFYPEHLGTTFVDIYRDLFAQRAKYPKGFPENAMLKLALNGVYGDSNNVYSVFYDPLYMAKITLNGQLLLCLLAEWVMKIPGLRILQINTDSLTMQVPRKYQEPLCEQVLAWERMTNLHTEVADYDHLFIADVNSYIGIHDDGTIKRKGRYDHVRAWHQDHSALVVPKVVERVLVHGDPIRATLEQWPDRMDFMLRIKAPRNAYLQWGDAQVQGTTRYLVCREGKPLTKWLSPLVDKTEWRAISVESGWNVQVCNNIRDADGCVPDWNYYQQEIEKLVLGVM